MSPGEISQSMEVNQFFFGKGGLTTFQAGNGFRDGYHVDIVLREAFLNQFIREKSDELLVANLDNERRKMPIKLEVSSVGSQDTGTDSRVVTLCNFIKKIGHLNDVIVAIEESSEMSSGSLAVNGHIFEVRNFLSHDGTYPVESLGNDPHSQLRDIAMGIERSYKLLAPT